MSRLPSLQTVLNSTIKTILKFPLETLAAVLGTIFAIIYNDLPYDYDASREFYTKGLLSCSLCLMLFLSVSLYFQASRKGNVIRFLTSIVLGSLVTGFVFSFKENITSAEIQQYFALSIVLHLLVSFAGFLPITYKQEEFWEFNKQLFIRILTSALYTVVLYCGLALAVLAVEKLFKVEFYDHIYFYIFFTIAGIFNTIFFLSGIPETNNTEKPLQLNYPKGLKNFTQFVLLPLISLYLVILICYESKILVTQSLPVGWVSYLVLIFAVFGILSFLLVHPIANQSGNLWMKTFNRWFYFLLIPLLILLFWAILYRINLYGFTHERYYVLLLSVWLAVVVGYFLIIKHPKIKFIPISMCIAGLFSIIGPQSADCVSKYSQLSRFENYMHQSSEKKNLTFEEEKDLSSIVTFLKDNYGTESMIPYAKTKLAALLKRDKKPSDYEIMEALGYEYRSYYETQQEDNNLYYSYYENESTSLENIHDYDISLMLSSANEFKCINCTKINNKSYSIKSYVKDYGVDLQINDDIVPLEIKPFIYKNFKHDLPSDEKITQTLTTPKYNILITYIVANVRYNDKKVTLNNYQVKVMIGIK
jgi:hypothetical protein